ncbi:hypothetical protein [Methylobacterium radiotolerans]
MKRLVIDLDDTLTVSDPEIPYPEKQPNREVVEQVRNYKSIGFEIIIQTARNMRTFQNSLGKINAHTLPEIIVWLKRHQIPFDEIHVGKPWCGTEGFYVDDRAVRPSEFVTLSYNQIQELLNRKPQTHG